MKYILVNKKVVATDDLSVWAEFYENDKNRVVTQTTTEHFFVSTVFLGLDHNFSGGAPITFETMIFKSNDSEIDFHDEYQERYATWEEAEAGHSVAINWALNREAEAKRSVDKVLQLTSSTSQ